MLKRIFVILIYISLSMATSINTNYADTYNIISNNNESLTIELSINNINLVEKNINNEAYTLLSINNSYPSTLIGEPNLPFINNLIEIPHESNIRIEIIENEIEEYNLNDYGYNNHILPVQPSISKSQNSDDIIFIKNEEIFLTE